jgi:hypothetical protein
MKRTSLIAFLGLACIACFAAAGCSKPDPADVPAEPKADSSESAATEEPKLSDADQALADAQKVCPVTDEALGSMGSPIKVMLGDRAVFVCCEACIEELKANADKYLAKIDAAATANTEATPAPEEPAEDEAPKAG